MGTGARPTAFVTDPAGFVGRHLVKHLVACGHEVFALAGSPAVAGMVREAGATAVIGDLHTRGRWQDEAAADWVFHLSPHAADRRRLGRWRGESAARARVVTDGNLLDAVGVGATRRVVYVADISVYGAVGAQAVTEDEPPRPSFFGHWFQPALDRIEGYAVAGLPIVTALPGLVYGNGSWFRDFVTTPIVAGRRVLQVGVTGPLLSAIHVHDCVRALMHLAEHGERGNRYFVVNSDPTRFNEFARLFARLANRPLRVCRVPAAAAGLIGGRALAGYLHSDAVFANIRLRGTGFRFHYPALEQGVRQVLGASI